MLLWVCFFIFTFYILMFPYRRRRRLDKLSSMIHPYGDQLPIIGFLHKMIGSSEDKMDQLKKLNYEAIENNGLIKTWLFNELIIFVADQVDAEKVLKVCLEKSDLNRFTKPFLGNGSIFSHSTIWKKRRKVIIPSFTPKIVENFVEIFAQQGEVLASKLAERASTGSFSAWPFASTYTLDSVTQTVLGVKIHAQRNPDNPPPFLVYLIRLLDIYMLRFFHVWLQPDWLFKMSSYSKEQDIAIRHMHEFTNGIIREKREELRVGNKIQKEIENTYDLRNFKTRTFLEHLILLSGNESGFTDIELREEVLTFIVAGSDTSAVAIANTLKMLQKYPQVQEKVYEEIHEVFGNSDRRLVKEDLLNLKYLERVVKETLRLFPPVPFITRQIMEDVTLPSGGLVPAGSNLVISIWCIHRNPKYWGPDADKFDPDRFLPERFTAEQNCGFMPFSQGPRNCPGYQFSLISIKSAITSILRKLLIMPVPEESDIPQMRLQINMMMKDAEGYQISVQLRET